MKRFAIRKMSETTAKREIGSFLMKKLSSGVTKLDVSDVSLGLKIPGTQVEKIFRQFIKEGRAKEL